MTDAADQIAATSSPNRARDLWVRYGWAGFIGASLGLSIARLLYETNPFRFATFGSAGASIGIAAAGALFWVLLTIIIEKRPAQGIFPIAVYVPIMLVWLYILTPPMQVDPQRGSIIIAGSVILSLTLAVPWLIAPGAEIPTHRRWIGTVIIAIIIFTIYLLTLQRTIGRADTFEFQVTAPVVGVAHPTGYPLCLLLGKLFSLLPLGKVATRVNLISAVAATVAVVEIYLTMRRVFHLDRFISGLSAVAFGLSPVFWSQAVIAEVYALHSAFAAAIIGGSLWLVTRFHQGVLVDNPSIAASVQADPSRYAARIVIILFALTGLSLSNHLTTVLLIPTVALALLIAQPRLTWKQWILAAGVFVAGLLIYLYIPLRWPALHDGRLMRWDEFWGWVTGSRFRGALQLQAWLTDPGRWQILSRLILDQYGWIGIVISAAGLILMVIRQWRPALITLTVFAAHAFYGLNYLVPDISVFLIPMFLIQAIWMGYGIAVTIGWFFRRYSIPTEEWVHGALVTIFAILPLSAAWITGASFDWSKEQALEMWGRRVLALPLDQDAAILADSEKVAPLEYLHRIEGIRPDMHIVVLGTEGEYLADLNDRIAKHQTVYLARFLPGLEGTYSLRSVGPLIEVSTTPLKEAPSLSDKPASWINGLTLIGAQTNQRKVHPGDEAWVMLYWQAQQPLANNVQVRAHLIDEGGQVYWQEQPAYPVSNRYPPVAWKDAEIVSDFHAVPMLYTLHPGTYTLQIGISLPFSPDVMLLKDGNEWVSVLNFEVLPIEKALPINGRRLAVTFTEGALVGADAPEQSTPHTETALAATWLSNNGSSKSEYRLPQDQSSADYSIIAQNSALRIHGSASGDATNWEIGGAPIRCGWLQPISQQCPLASTQIEGQAVAQAVANFDSKMLLAEVVFEVGRLTPGQNVDVTLNWQALSQMDEDYTIFVHLLGPDGRLHGQIDQWPVEGTYPTSTWKLGASIEDHYSVPLDADAPPGSYQLEIGVYLLATNTRLPVLNSDGIPIDDHVLLGGLIVPK